jgi:DNA damage-inducible protein 1
MRICVTDELGNVQNLEVSTQIRLSEFKKIVPLNIPPDQQQLVYNGVELRGDNPLSSYGVKDNDILLIKRSMKQAEVLRNQILNNPALRQQLQQQNPLLTQALQNPAQFERIFNEMQRIQNADPFDVQAQLKIEEEIRRRNIEENMSSALEFHPESFGSVCMLYINCQVNGMPLKAFVDSGAQMTIMSPSCAEKCNIMHLLDRRFEGIAKGVGTAKILGRVHSAQIQVGSLFLHCSFTVMEGKDVDLLFGLDMLKRHQVLEYNKAVIDLSSNVLRIGNEAVEFLPEHLLKESAEEIAQSKTTEEIAQSKTTGEIAQSKTTGEIAQTKTSGANPHPKYSDAITKNLTDLGFSMEQVVQALDAAQGNPDMAADLLFQQ